MTNQFIIVGRIVSITKNDDNSIYMSVAVNRCFKNEEGIYETDILQCFVKGGIAQSTLEYCKNGDIVGVRGRIETINNHILLIGEKLTFLSARRENNED